jgi:hypothetical protein
MERPFWLRYYQERLKRGVGIIEELKERGIGEEGIIEGGILKKRDSRERHM